MVNDVAYMLALPETMKIHNVFHVSLLKRYIPSPSFKPPPPPVLKGGSYEYVVEKILLHRDKKVGKSTKREYYVLWQGHGIENASWEPEANCRNAKALVDAYWAEVNANASATAARKTHLEQR